MIDLEVVSVGTDDGELAVRLSSRVSDMQGARAIADRLVRDISGQQILSVSVVSHHRGVFYCLAYKIPGGGIVGFANLFEVVGE